MSWTNECSQSNSFKTKNNEEVSEVLSLLGFDVYNENDSIRFYGDENAWLDEDAEVFLSIKPHKDIETGEVKNLHGIISDYTGYSLDIDEVCEQYNYKEDNGDYMIVSLVEYLQDMLLDDKQYITITGAGFEGRTSGNSSPFGFVDVITKYDFKSENLAHLREELLKEMKVEV